MSTQPDVKLVNRINSSGPCPSCVEASGQPAMIYQEWASSQWGLPGSGLRYCESNCHCMLVPENILPELPWIGKRVKLRGDENTDIKPVIEIGPNEMELKILMEKWNKHIGKLPKQIYSMTAEEALIYMGKHFNTGMELGLIPKMDIKKLTQEAIGER